MRWPWKRTRSQDRLVVSWSAQTLTYVLARRRGSGAVEVLRAGTESLNGDSMDVFVSRLKALGLTGLDAVFMLRPEQCQLLQLAAPAVAPEELRSAMRYQIRDMVDVHIDDLTLDVLHVGDGLDKGSGQVFVVTAATALIRDLMALADAAAWVVSVIDVHEMAQRNLQSALVARGALPDRATAALMVANDRQALLTICAKGELFYSRRLDLPPGFLTMEWGSSANVVEDKAAQFDQFTPVGEYVPDYVDNYLPGGMTAAATSTQADADRAQRFVVEVQRSLDLWDRTWSGLPLASVTLYAADRSLDRAEWLSQELGQMVTAFDMSSLFSGLECIDPKDAMACWPLLGVLLRHDDYAS